MKKLEHFISKGIYYIMAVDKENDYEEILMTVELMEDKYPFVEISLPDKVYTGPISLLEFEKDLRNNERENVLN